MGSSDDLRRLGGLDEAAVATACEDRQSFGDLLARVAATSSGASSATALHLLARLAASSCTWLDGDLVIELVEEDEVTVVRIMTELGDGMRERALPPCTFRTPLSAFASAIDAEPTIVGSLNVRKNSWRRMTLFVSEQARRSTRPPRVSISDTSLCELVPASSKPDDSHGGSR